LQGNKRRNEDVMSAVKTENDYLKLIGIISEVFGSFSPGENLLRHVEPEEIKEMEKEKVFIACTFGGAVFVHTKKGRVTSIDPLTIPEDVRQYSIEARGKVFKPPRKCLPDMWGHAYRRWVYDSNRVRYPLKRVGWEPGGTGSYDNRGLAEFIRISWDEALELVTKEMQRLKETYGNSAITYQYGSHKTWGTLHGIGTEGALLSKFFDALGGFTQYVMGTMSWAGWVSGAAFVYGFWWARGTSDGTDTLMDTLQNSRMVVYWSLDSTKSARMYIGHESELWRHWVRDAGIKTIAICPEYNDTAAAHADRWIPVYPGSDAALAASIMHVWITENTYDREYVNSHAVGFEKLKDYILGNDDGIVKTPEWAEAICGIDSETIIGLAREWAAGPTSLNCQLGGANRGWYGHEWTRMMVALQTLQGLGKPGVNLASWAQSGGAPYNKDIYFPGYGTGVKPVEAKPHVNPVPQRVHAIDVSDCILNPPVKWRGGTSGGAYAGDEFFENYSYPVDGYSEVKMLFQLGGGHFDSYPNVNWRIKGYMSPKLETTVRVALFMEPLIRYSDIVLPSCTDLERNDISLLGCTGSYVPYTGEANHQVALYQQMCMNPIGQSMSDMEIIYNLARKLGIEEEVSEGNTEDDWIKKLFEISSLPEFIKYEEFKKRGYYVFPFPENYEPTPALRWFYEKEEGEGLATPSGKIEIYSKTLADFYGENNPEIPPVPKYIEPRDGRNSPVAEKYPLAGFFPHPKFRFHTMMENVTWFRELEKIKSADGQNYEPVWINPLDAKARGISPGDVVVVFNDKGKTLAGAYLTERIKPGTIRMDYGSHWDPEDPRTPGSLDKGGSANVVTTNQPMSDHCHMHRIHHNMVDVCKWEVES